MLIGYSLWVQIFLSEVSRTGQHVPCSSRPRRRLLLTQTRAEQSCYCAGHPRSRPPPVLSAGASPTSSSTSTAQQQARPCSTPTGIGHLRAASCCSAPNIKLLPPAIPRLIRGLGKHPHSLLYPPQQAPFHFSAGADLPTSSRGGNNGRSWPTIFHPFPRAPSHLNRTSSLSSLSPCPRLREWSPGAPFPWSYVRAHCNGDQGSRAAIRVSPDGFMQ